jgi:hypothetical protein
VDGRPYQDPAFRQMLEKYHAAALRAHKEHAGVEAMIPVPVPPPPVPVTEVPRADDTREGSRRRLQEGTDPSRDPDGA